MKPDLTLKSRRTAGSSLSPTKKFNASGTSTHASGLDRTRRVTSPSNAGTENRSVMWITIPGFSCHACLANVVHIAYRRGVSCCTRSTMDEQLTSVIALSIVPVLSTPRLGSFVGLFHTSKRRISFSTSRRSTWAMLWAPCSTCSVSFDSFKASDNVRGVGLGDRLERDGLFRPTSLPRQDKNSDNSFTSVWIWILFAP